MKWDFLRTFQTLWFKIGFWYLLHFEHDVLIGDKSFLATHRAFPPVIGDLLEKHNGVSLVEIDFACRTCTEIIQCLGYQRIWFCKEKDILVCWRIFSIQYFFANFLVKSKLFRTAVFSRILGINSYCQKDQDWNLAGHLLCHYLP